MYATYSSPKPGQFIGLGGKDVAEPYALRWFGDNRGPKSYRFIRFRGRLLRTHWYCTCSLGPLNFVSSRLCSEGLLLYRVMLRAPAGSPGAGALGSLLVACLMVCFSPGSQNFLSPGFSQPAKQSKQQAKPSTAMPSKAKQKAMQKTKLANCLTPR